GSSDVRCISPLRKVIVVIHDPTAAAEYFFHIGKQRFPQPYGGFEFSRLYAVINDVASPLASYRIWYSVYQSVARLLSLLGIQETKGDPHAEGGSCDIMMTLVEPFGP